MAILPSTKTRTMATTMKRVLTPRFSSIGGRETDFDDRRTQGRVSGDASRPQLRGGLRRREPRSWHRGRGQTGQGHPLLRQADYRYPLASRCEGAHVHLLRLLRTMLILRGASACLPLGKTPGLEAFCPRGFP